MYINSEKNPKDYFDNVYSYISNERESLIKSYDEQLKQLSRVIASDHLKNFNEFVEDLKASNAYNSIYMTNDDQRGNCAGSIQCNLTSRDAGQYGWRPSVVIKVPFGLDGNNGFYLSGVTASSVRWIRCPVKFPKVYLDLKGDKFDYFVNALKFIGQVVRKYDDVYPDPQKWNLLFSDYSASYRIPNETDTENYAIYMSACSMQNKFKKYFEIHSLCKERVCK